MTMISASFQGRNVVRCISTFAVMGASDPELAASRRRFAEYLEETGSMAAGTDPGERLVGVSMFDPAPAGRWRHPLRPRIPARAGHHRGRSARLRSRRRAGLVAGRL
jgi:hypothetical protein